MSNPSNGVQEIRVVWFVLWELIKISCGANQSKLSRSNIICSVKQQGEPPWH